jgi:hypothetical protein
VRTLLNAGLAMVLSSAMVVMPVMAAPANPASAPLGVVMQAERATVGADITSGGATIYDGDRLETSGGGTLRARLGGAQIYLRPSTVANVHNLSNGFSANLLGGTVVVSSAEGQSFQLVADGATIRPAGPQATVAQVTWVSPTQLLLAANRGTVQITLGDEVETINAGSSYRLEIQPEDAGPGPQGSGGGPQQAGHSHRLLLILIGSGVAAGAAIGIWRVMVSPNAP